MILKKIKHIHEVHGWSIGVVDHEEAYFSESWEITTNSGGEYFIWAEKDSELMMVWVRITPSNGEVFATCTVPAHVLVRHKKKEIEIAILKPKEGLKYVGG